MTAVKIEVGQVWSHISPGITLGDWRVTRIKDGYAFVDQIKDPAGKILKKGIDFCRVDSKGMTNDLDCYWSCVEIVWAQNAIQSNNGLNCKKCQEHFPMAESNQSDGTLVCWSCKNYPFYKGRL